MSGTAARPTSRPVHKQTPALVGARAATHAKVHGRKPTAGRPPAARSSLDNATMSLEVKLQVARKRGGARKERGAEIILVWPRRRAAEPQWVAGRAAWPRVQRCSSRGRAEPRMR